MRRTVAMLASSMLIVTALVAGEAPVGAANSQPAQRYIVVLDGDADSRATARQHARSEGAQVEQVYRHALSGYSATMSPAAAARIAQRAEVRSVEADQQVSVTAQTIPTGIPRSFATSNGNLDIDGTDDWRVDADVAVIDTGIDLDHPDLNVVQSTDCRYNNGGPSWKRTYWCDSGGDDGNGHGTHVGGTIGAIDDGNGVVGIAPGVRLWAVKVLDDNGSGSMSAVVAGVDYVAANAASIEVANMSLGCACSSSALDTALDGARAKGVTFAVSAGNSDADSANYSPASNAGVLTVSALADFDGAPGGLGSPTCRTDQDDTLADFSNWGSRVDITAPGVCILSTYKNGGYATISGTSMSSPHVAGAAAVLASAHSYGTERDGADVTTIQNTLVSEGNLNWTDDSGDGIKERLLDLSDTGVFAPVKVAGSGGTSEPEPNAAPVGNDDAASTTPGQAVEIAVLANDTDANSDTLTVTNLSQPASGTGSAAYDSSTKKVTYTPPDSTWTGTATFTYTPHDGTVAGNTTTVTVTVAEEATPPPAGDLDVSVSYATEGGRLNNNHLLVTVTVMNGTSAASGASVSVAITTGSTTATGTGTTGSDGKVTFKWTNAPSGSYTTDVTRVVTADSTDHGDVAETDPGFTK